MLKLPLVLGTALVCIWGSVSPAYTQVNYQRQLSQYTTHSQGIDYLTIGRNIRGLYENPTTYRWPDGARGVFGDDGSVVRITKQTAADGNVLYYMRLNQESRILRYNATRDSMGYTDVWSYSIGHNYLKARVTVLTDFGRYLNEPQIINVETNEMYPAFRTLLNF